jgi:hypothetical protein
MDKEFGENFRKLLDDNINEACLIGLTSLILRNIIDEENEKSYQIINIINNLNDDRPEILKLKSIIKNIVEYDSKFIEILSDFDIRLSKMLYDSEDCCCSSKQQVNENSECIKEEETIDIKKWWE